MERLKTELLMIGKLRGDSGTTEQQTRWIDNYMDALDRYLRPEGIKAFTAEQLRDPYVEYMKTIITTGDREEAAQCVIRFFHTKRHERDKLPEVLVSSDSVVDIFSRRS